MIKLKNIIKKYNDLSSIINKIDNEKIKNLDIYNLSYKLLLYQPLEDSFILFINLDLYYLNKNSNILITSENYSFIEYLKYQTEKEYNFYLSDKIMMNIPDNKLKYLTKYTNINEEIDIKFDIILINDINKLDFYKNKINEDGVIIYIGKIDEIIDNIDILKEINLIKPEIIKQSGEFVGIYKNEKISKKNPLKFLYNHINRLIKILKTKNKLLNLGNIDIQNKLINVYKNKIYSDIIFKMNKYDIPIKTEIIKYYDLKLITITNKLYSSIDLISFQFINYEDIQYDIEINNNLNNDNLNNISLNLNKIKRAIDTRDLKKWYDITFKLDNFKSLSSYLSKKLDIFTNKSIQVTNAFLKIYEMLYSYQLFDILKPDLKSFHFCEAPGMFILGINHFIKTKTNIKKWDWYGNSLPQDPDNKALGDNYDLMKKFPDRWLNGDIRKIENIKKFKEILGEVDFITSDCGICVEYSDMNKYEELISETDFAQFINMINLLSLNGSGILKMFIPIQKPSNISIIYLATQIFNKVFISKPITSRPHNSEIYIICIGFKGFNNIDKLLNILEKNYDSNKSFIKNIPESFIKQLEDYILEITRQQISYLLNIFHFLDNKHEMDKILLLKNNTLKNNSNEYWLEKFNISSNKSDKLI